jgi:hypothetical protein
LTSAFPLNTRIRQPRHLPWPPQGNSTPWSNNKSRNGVPAGALSAARVGQRIIRWDGFRVKGLSLTFQVAASLPRHFQASLPRHYQGVQRRVYPSLGGPGGGVKPPLHQECSRA